MFLKNRQLAPFPLPEDQFVLLGFFLTSPMCQETGKSRKQDIIHLMRLHPDDI